MSRRITMTLLKSKTDPETRSKNGVAGPVYKGIMLLGPSVGESFNFYRDDGYQMWTSPVERITFESNDMIHIKTKNSVYNLEIGPEINK